MFLDILWDVVAPPILGDFWILFLNFWLNFEEFG